MARLSSVSGNARDVTAAASLLSGAALWGVVWYPYRILDEAGASGALATLATYAVALIVVSLARPEAWRDFRREPWMLAGIALGAGWSIVAYVEAVMHSEVVRVLLLFYLSPLWTLPLARIFLHEKPPPAGYAVVAVALAGAMIMLWDPASGLPLPANVGEWLALSAGFAFALSNVCVRKARASGIVGKSLAVWLGAVLLAALAYALEGSQRAEWSTLNANWPLVLAIGAGVLLMSLCIQYGLTHLQANRAAILMLFEIVVAAFAAYWLAGETLALRDWIGGALIIGAGLCSDLLRAK